MPDIRRHEDPGAQRAPDPRPRAPIPDPSRAFAEPSSRRRASAPAQARPSPHGLAGQIAMAAEPLPDLDDPAFGRLFDRFGEARVLLLGAAGDGVAEFCRARAAITRWLIENRGFNAVVLEADDAAARSLDARVRGRRRASDAGAGVDGPWRSAEFDAFLAWLGDHNSGRSPGAQASIHGLDLYNHDAALQVVTDHLDRIDPQAAEVARARYGGRDPWPEDEPLAHGRPALSAYANGEAATTSRLVDLLERQMREMAGSDQTLLDAGQSARLLRDAQAHYRALYDGGPQAWNVRTKHMFATLNAVLDAKGGDAKVVVWANNAHAGDARATDMSRLRDELSLGQLCRQAWPDQTRLIGFGAYEGAVASFAVDGPRRLPPAAPDSHESLSHEAGVDRFLLDLRPNVNSGLRRCLAEPRAERFLGHGDRGGPIGHDLGCRLPEQFDAWVWFDQATALTPGVNGR